MKPYFVTAVQLIILLLHGEEWVWRRKNATQSFICYHWLFTWK